MMRVAFDEFDRHGRELAPTLILCERHARIVADRLHARWPEPHEHAATTRDANGYRTRIQVLNNCMDPCDECQHEQELTQAEAVQAAQRAFETLSAKMTH